MFVVCSHCTIIFKSILVDKQKALQEIMDAVGTHLAQNHKQKQIEFGKDLGLIAQNAAWLVLIMKHTNFLNYEPKDNDIQGQADLDFVEDKIAKTLSTMREIIGIPEDSEDIEVEQEDEENLEEEEEETDIENEIEKESIPIDAEIEVEKENEQPAKIL